jgi:hypothetical protein
MSEFMKDVGTYESRKVARDDFPWGFVSTARVNDGDKPYETAVKHDRYDHTKMVIVASYLTAEEATIGHAEWVKRMTADELPPELVDCGNSSVSKMSHALGIKRRFLLDGVDRG